MDGAIASGRRAPLAVVAVVLVTLLLRAWVDLRSGGLAGAGSIDDGVHYAAAASLVAGRMPYRDFLFLHPPGIVLALTPFAAAGRVLGDATAFEVARAGGIVLGAVNAGLLVVVLRRFGLAAGLTGGLVYACAWPAVFAERSALLEPLGCCLLLIACALTVDRSSRRRAVLAGCALGAAVVVKLTFVPLAVIVLLAMRRRGAAAALAAVGLAALVCLPFLVAAPAAMWQQVVLDQLGRRRIVPLLGLRLAGMVLPPVVPGVPQRIALAAVLGLAAILAVVGLSTRGARRYAAMLLVEVPLLLAAPSFYGHYAVLVALPLAASAGVAVARLRTTVSGRARPVAVIGAVVVLAVVVLGPWTPARVAKLSSPRLPDGLVAAVQGASGCVVSDTATTLVLASTVSRDLERGCALWPDVSGWQYDRIGRPAAPAPTPEDDARYQRRVVGYLRSGEVVVLSPTGGDLSAASRSEVLSGEPLWSGARGVVQRTSARR